MPGKSDDAEAGCRGTPIAGRGTRLGAARLTGPIPIAAVQAVETCRRRSWPPRARAAKHQAPKCLNPHLNRTRLNVPVITEAYDSVVKGNVGAVRLPGDL